MSTLAEVRLWGKTIGAVSLQDGEEVASFEYDAAFVQSGIQVAPMVMPLSRRSHNGMIRNYYISSWIPRSDVIAR
jgi:serine/threonine-protein kinase HipA